MTPLHLKRVEMENFKSFGRKLSVPFLAGFTAITGPNGSGKSNIGDAILFVLGPKSNKAIRAGKLTDLIFNGGKERKPADHCKVSLVFDNADRVIPVEADEVSLTRLVKLSKASPENYYSYFYVNGKPSSLGEFDNLLAHSRISADGYNIVRQGDVLRIVEMTPLERRRILDEIAGIATFDEDIGKAGVERAGVEQNLDRVRIILDEIERQLATLERERDAALRYKAVKDDLDRHRAKLARKRLAGMTAELAGVRDQISSQEAERTRLLEAAEAIRREVAGAERDLAAIDERIAERGGAEAREIKAKIDALRGEAIRATERLNYARQEIADLKKDRADFTADLKRVEKDVARHEKELAAASARKVEVDARLTERQGALDGVRETLAQGSGRASELTRELAQIKVDHERTSAEAHAARLERDRLAEKSERLRAAVGELGDQVETHAFEVKDAEWELSEIGKDAGSTQGGVEESRRGLFAKKKRESELATEIKELDPVVRRLQNEYSRLKAEQEASEAVSKGYTRAVDGVLAARDQGKLAGICGTIAELGRVDARFETAMEIAAGGRMQAIVTESDADAARAIEFLKQHRLGRATFLPLNKMVPGRPAGKPLMAVRDPGAEGFAIDLIRYDDRFKAAFWYVFRDAVIVKTLDVARKISGGTRLVTLDGDLIDAGGAMTGGDLGDRHAAKVGFGAVARESLEKVALQLRAAIAHQEQISADLLALREEIQTFESLVREGVHSVSQKAERVKELTKRRDEFAARLVSLAAERAAREQELAEAAQTIAVVDASIADFGRQISELEARRDRCGKLLLAATSKELARELASLDKDVADLREAARDLTSELATKSHNLDLLRERKAELDAKAASIEAAIAGHEAASADAGAVVEARERDLQVLLEVESRQNEESRALQAQRDRAFEHRAGLAQRLAKVAERADTTGDLVATLRARVPAVEDAIRELAAEVAQFVHLAEVEIPESQEQLRARVRSLEAQLEALGNVNMLALDEYDRQASRKRDLAAEVERLVAEREKLIALVDELVQRKKVDFDRVFHEINRNFAEVFARLSDGGKAELILENPDMPFDGGLLMRAQPKGKKLTRLEALSGGEKSLTSMAFIFAIQEFDPSPFYYLDEVDQNLDGINSELLARMVCANSRRSQTIMVSLRKVSLKEADHVYGVTMTDAGLSEVVGEVRLSEIVDEPLKREAAPGGGSGGFAPAHSATPDRRDSASPAGTEPPASTPTTPEVQR